MKRGNNRNKRLQQRLEQLLEQVRSLRNTIQIEADRRIFPHPFEPPIPFDRRRRNRGAAAADKPRGSK